jgi:radical SAM enzyme (TIGR01210 family)
MEFSGFAFTLRPPGAGTSTKITAPGFDGEREFRDGVRVTTMSGPTPDRIEHQIARGSHLGQKQYVFDETHDPTRPAGWWFQESEEGEILFVVFYSQACRWSRCLGCNLPSQMSRHHVDFKALMRQVDYLFAHPDVVRRYGTLRKVIVSNNGSILDEETFSSTALMYLVARLNIHLPRVAVLSLETRVEYVEVAELEFLARALKEGATPAALEVAVGFEAFDERIRNEVFLKGLRLDRFEDLCRKLAVHHFRLKCYFMQKPVPGMSDEEGVQDIRRAIDYLSQQAREHQLQINLHLNPTYAARGTVLETCFRQGSWAPPRLRDVARAALHAAGKGITVYLGLSDEHLACEGGSFVRPGDEAWVERLALFNRTQDYRLLQDAG